MDELEIANLPALELPVDTITIKSVSRKMTTLQRIATFLSLQMKMFRQIRLIGRWTNLKFANAGTDFKGYGNYLEKKKT